MFELIIIHAFLQLQLNMTYNPNIYNSLVKIAINLTNITTAGDFLRQFNNFNMCIGASQGLAPTGICIPDPFWTMVLLGLWFFITLGLTHNGTHFDNAFVASSTFLFLASLLAFVTNYTSFYLLITSIVIFAIALIIHRTEEGGHESGGGISLPIMAKIPSEGIQG
jgi:hypothetical protein